MKIKQRKLYSSKKLFWVAIFSATFLFTGFIGISSASMNHLPSGTLSASPTTAYPGEQITISITGNDDDGLVGFEIYYNNTWHREDVSGISATRTWTIIENLQGTYKYKGRVVGINSDPSTHTGWLWGETESAPTSPEYIEVVVSDFTPPSCADECSYSGKRRCYDSANKQICGQYDSDSCLEWSSPISCSGNTSCGYGRCDDDERPNWRCSGGSCTYTCNYSSSCAKISCECSKGPCCDGCNYRTSAWICDFETQTQYGCPWGLACGADAGKRTKTRYKYCSGTSSQCSGKWHSWLPWTDWKISDSCSSNEVCVVGSPHCQYSSACVKPKTAYIKEYRKSCYDNDIYWFDSNGKRQGKEQECSDENSCTIDGCENNVCFNTLKCDGTTCEIGSSEYCQSCEHCGDDICNCEENNDTCCDDCKIVCNGNELAKGEAAVGLTLKSLLKKWYVWILLGIAAIILLSWLFRKSKE